MMTKLLFFMISCVCFCFSLSAFAADYSQTQNKADDKMNSPKEAETKSFNKKDNVTGRQNYDKNEVDVRDRKLMDDKRRESQNK